MAHVALRVPFDPPEKMDVSEASFFFAAKLHIRVKLTWRSDVLLVGLRTSSLVCISHHMTAGARDTTAMTPLRLLAVLDVLFKYTCACQAARASS